MSALRFLTVQEVIAINITAIQKYSPGEQIGVKSSSLLESAILRPKSSAFGDDAYPTLFEKSEDFTVEMVNHEISFEQVVETIRRYSSKTN
jgi:prophage maintenance system killer protein